MPNAIVASEVWSKALLEKIAPITVGMNFVSEPPESDEIYQQGDRVQTVIPGSVSVTSYTKGTDLTPSTLTDSKEALIIDTPLAWNFDVDHIERAQANPYYVASVMSDAANRMAKAIDAHIFAGHTSAIAGNKITGASSAALKLSENDPYELLVDAAVKLGDLDVPLGDRWAVINPYTHGVLLKNPDFIRASALGDLVISTARFDGATASSVQSFVGRIAGFDIYVSSNLPTAANKTYLLYGQSKPFSFVSQLNTVEAVPLARQFATNIKQLVLIGRAVLGDNKKRLGSIYVENA